MLMGVIIVSLLSMLHWGTHNSHPPDVATLELDQYMLLATYTR